MIIQNRVLKFELPMKNPLPAHLIVVDNEPITRELIASYLRKEDYSVSEAGDGSELETYWQSRCPI